jgi:hypothetical protein
LGKPLRGLDSVPAELATLVRTAMASRIDDRTASAEAFRIELVRFLRMRDAERVATAAREAIARAEALLARDGPASADAYEAMIEARFGLASALETRPDDAGFRSELDACNARLAERELALGSVAGARTMLARLSVPRPDLEERTKALELAQQTERAAASDHGRARRQADTSGAVPALMVIAALCALPVFVAVAWFGMDDSTAKYEHLIGADIVLLSFMSAGTMIMRKGLFATEASRRLTSILLTWCASCCASDFVSLAVGSTLSQAAAHSIFTGVVVTVAATVTVQRDFWPIPLINTAGLVAAIAFPDRGHVALGASLLISLFVIAQLVRRTGRRSRVPN